MTLSFEYSQFEVYSHHHERENDKTENGLFLQALAARGNDFKDSSVKESDSNFYSEFLRGIRLKQELSFGSQVMVSQIEAEMKRLEDEFSNEEYDSYEEYLDNKKSLL